MSTYAGTVSAFWQIISASQGPHVLIILLSNPTCHLWCIFCIAFLCFPKVSKMFLEAKTSVSQTTSMGSESQKAAVALLKFIIVDGACQRKEEKGKGITLRDLMYTLSLCNVHCTMYTSKSEHISMSKQLIYVRLTRLQQTAQDVDAVGPICRLITRCCPKTSPSLSFWPR